VVGLIVCVVTWIVPFSQARAAADYIRTAHLNTLLMIGDSDFSVSPIAAYLDQPFFFVSGQRMGTFIVWDSKCCVLQNHGVLESAVAKARDQQQNVLVVLNYPSSPSPQGVREIASFQGAIVEDENYHLYLVDHHW
jgi:hypothetical protein